MGLDHWRDFDQPAEDFSGLSFLSLGLDRLGAAYKQVAAELAQAAAARQRGDSGEKFAGGEFGWVASSFISSAKGAKLCGGVSTLGSSRPKVTDLAFLAKASILPTSRPPRKSKVD